MTRKDDGTAAEPRWTTWDELRSQSPYICLAMAPILALAVLGPAIVDPVLVFGAALVLGASTGSLLTTLLLAVAAVAAWMWPLLL